MSYQSNWPNYFDNHFRTSISSIESRLTGSPGSASKAGSLGYASAAELAQLVHLQQQQAAGHVMIKPPMLPPKASHVQQPPYVAPPLYENLQDVSSFSLNGETEKLS